MENNATQIYNFSLRKEVYISWHTPCSSSNFFLCLLWLWILHSFKVKKKKFWEKIYYNYLQSSNDLKSGEKKRSKFFFVLFLCIMPLGGNIFVTIVNTLGRSTEEKTLLGLGFFYSEFWNIFQDPLEIFFLGQIFFIFVDQSYWRNFSCYGL